MDGALPTGLLVPTAGFMAGKYMPQMLIDGPWPGTRRAFSRLFQLSLGLVAFVMTCGDAFACRTADSHRTIFFDAVPQGGSVQTILRVAITKVVAPAEYIWKGKPFAFVGIPRVDRVLQGSGVP